MESNVSTTESSVIAGWNDGTEASTMDPAQERIDFYRTYDVMTGVRIAATLGGFFSLMVLLVLYKSKCKSKSLSDEQLDAVAEAVVEQEDRERELALAAAAVPTITLGGRHAAPRRSLGNMSAPPSSLLSRNWRHSYSMEPPGERAHCLYNYQRGRSLPGSSLRFPCGMAMGNGANGSGGGPVATADSLPDDADDDEELLEEEEEGEEQLPEESPRAAFTMQPSCVCVRHRFLEVPGGRSRRDSRRLSSITCSSSDSSYLERRGSAAELGLPAPPPLYRRYSRRASAAMPEEPWDFYYPIDIQVIQPTPEASPCGSEHTLYQQPTAATSGGGMVALLRVPSQGGSAMDSNVVRLPAGPAPLASIGSCAVSLDYPDIDMRSVGSDSVFLDDAELDTEDEVDGFSTDSDGENSPPLRTPLAMHFLQVPGAAAALMGTRSRVAPGARWGPASAVFEPRRRLSMPACPRQRPAVRSTASLAVESVDGDLATQLIARRPPLPLPSASASESTVVGAAGDSSPSTGSCCSLGPSETSSGSATLRGSARPSTVPRVVIPLCEHSELPDDGRSWSQETLF